MNLGLQVADIFSSLFALQYFYVSLHFSCCCFDCRCCTASLRFFWVRIFIVDVVLILFHCMRLSQHIQLLFKSLSRAVYVCVICCRCRRCHLTVYVYIIFCLFFYALRTLKYKKISKEKRNITVSFCLALLKINETA